MKKQSGFTLVEVLLVVIAVSLLAGMSVFAFTRIQDTDKDADTAKSVSTSKAEKSETKSSWYVFQPEDKKYKISLPDGWRFVYTPASDENDKISYLYASNQNMKSSAGVSAQVVVEPGGYGPEAGFTLSVHQNPGPVGYGEGLKSEGSFKTDQGKQVDVFKDEEATEPFSEPAEGSMSEFTQYEYYLVGSNNTVYKFIYSFAAGDANQKQAIEKTIKSIQLP